MHDSDDTQPRTERQPQGEGNKAADRSYRKGASQHAESGQSQRAAREAEKALDSEEADELEQAEAEGKSRARDSRSDAD